MTFSIGLNQQFLMGEKLRTFVKNAFFSVFAESHYLNLGAPPAVGSDVDPDPFGSVDPEV